MNIDLKRLTALLGDEARALRFVDVFEKNLPGELARLRGFFEKKDWESASTAAHGLKSQCRYLGLDRAAELLERVEAGPEGFSFEEVAGAFG